MSTSGPSPSPLIPLVRFLLGITTGRAPRCLEEQSSLPPEELAMNDEAMRGTETL